MGDCVGIKNQKGQVVLIIVLVMVVALTVTLSLVSRSITNVRTTTDQANSQKALAAAEAGIERTLKSGVAIGAGTFSDNNTTYSTTITQVSGSIPFLVNGGNPISKDDGANIWLTPYSTTNPWSGSWTGTINIHWGDNSGRCNNAAVEVVTIKAPSGNPTTTRYVFDPCQARANGNNFDYSGVSAASQTIETQTLQFRASVPVTNGLLMRVIPLYKNSYIGASSSTPLPQQGAIVTSTGTLDTTQRKITVYQSNPELPAELFPFSLLSP